MFKLQVPQDIAELRRLRTVIQENEKLQGEVSRMKDYLLEVIQEHQVWHDKIKGLMPRLVELDGSLTSHARRLHDYAPEKLKEAVKRL